MEPGQRAIVALCGVFKYWSYPPFHYHKFCPPKTKKTLPWHIPKYSWTAQRVTDTSAALQLHRVVPILPTWGGSVIWQREGGLESGGGRKKGVLWEGWWWRIWSGLCVYRIFWQPTLSQFIAPYSVHGLWREGETGWGSLIGLVVIDMIRFLQSLIIFDALGPMCGFSLGTWSTKKLRGGRLNPGSWFMVGGLEPGGGSLSGLVLADLVTDQTGDLGGGGGIFSLLSLYPPSW